MAESVAFGLASKILSTLASPAFDKAYEKGLSIWNARDELKKLQVTIETLQAVLLDAEKKQRNSAAIKNWIKRLKGVLYDAEDFFDEVVTDDLLKKQMVEGQNKLSLKKKVRLYCSTSNPILSRNSIAKKVQAIRKSLLEISTDMDTFGFVSGQRDEPVFGMRIGQDPGSFVDPKHVFGRDGDKKSILDMLFKESNDAKPYAPSVIVVVGIGGMGKTTLAQLIYNDDEVGKNFPSRWFACISDTADEMEVVGKIFQSICGGNYVGFTLGHLQDKIRDSVKDMKFLLVLDDVWDEGHSRWQHRMSLLGGGAKGSKIVVTTRSLEVAKAFEVLEPHTLSGLSEEDSWELFKSEAFTPEKKNDRRWEDLGREILKKCARVPLAIRSIGSLLRTKDTIGEWKSFKDKELSEIEEHCGQDHIMSVLKLSYDHLPSNMKHCFAYCSLFSKDFVFRVSKLIYLWISQGYIQLDKEGNSFEEVGRSYFMNLLRRSFFQEAREDGYGEIRYCKMHDLVHDLAKSIAGEETVILNKPSSQYGNARHAHVCYEPHNDDDILPPVDSMNGLRSFVLSNGTWVVDQQFRSCKWLRALSLSWLGIENVPICIGELKLLRYLDLSGNNFEQLPDSLPNLLNLLALDLRDCKVLEALPDNFRKLINLRYLNIGCCNQLKHMPAGFGELRSLQYLSDFKIGSIEGDIETAREEKERIRSTRSRLDALSGLQQIRGALRIDFSDDGVEEEDYGGDECWKLPVSPQALTIGNYPGMRIPDWAATNDPSHLVSIELKECPKVKHLPPFRCLPYLHNLELHQLDSLEYIEEGEEGAMSVSLFFPSLKTLELSVLPELKGWSRNKNTPLLSFPLLSQLEIESCPGLKCMPSSSACIDLELQEADCVLIEHLLLSSSSSLQHILICDCIGTISFPGASLTSLQECRIGGTSFSNNLHLASPHLQSLKVVNCSGVTSVEVEVPAPSLSDIEIRGCSEVRSLRFAHPSALEQLRISDCPELVLGWSSALLSFPLLSKLKIASCPGLKYMPSSPCVNLVLKDVDGVLIEHVLFSSSSSLQNIKITKCIGTISFPGASLTSLQGCRISRTSFSNNLHLASPHLRRIEIKDCSGVTSVEVEVPTPSLSVIEIRGCSEVRSLRLAHPSALEHLIIRNCPELVLEGVDWDSLPNLRVLQLEGVDRKELPQCLLRLEALGQLEIILWYPDDEEQISDDEEQISEDEDQGGAKSTYQLRND